MKSKAVKVLTLAGVFGAATMLASAADLAAMKRMLDRKTDASKGVGQTQAPKPGMELGRGAGTTMAENKSARQLLDELMAGERRRQITRLLPPTEDRRARVWDFGDRFPGQSDFWNPRYLCVPVAVPNTPLQGLLTPGAPILPMPQFWMTNAFRGMLPFLPETDGWTAGSSVRLLKTIQSLQSPMEEDVGPTSPLSLVRAIQAQTERRRPASECCDAFPLDVTGNPTALRRLLLPSIIPPEVILEPRGPGLDDFSTDFMLRLGVLKHRTCDF
jgi:hypothetical protein